MCTPTELLKFDFILIPLGSAPSHTELIACLEPLETKFELPLEQQVVFNSDDLNSKSVPGPESVVWRKAQQYVHWFA